MWVSIRRECENLGLDFSNQLKKLKSKAWAVVVENTTTGSDGKTYQMVCCDLDTLPGWLFSIDARKVKESIREKLARYQREAGGETELCPAGITFRKRPNKSRRDTQG